MYNPMGMPNRPGNNVFAQPQYPMQQPAPYQPYSPSYASRLQQMEQQMGQSSVPQMTWVNGIEGAKAYILPPNSTIMLMDSDAPKFYIKKTDNNGQPFDLKAYRFEEDIQPMPQNNYVAPEAVENMQHTITSLQQEITQCRGQIEELYSKLEGSNNATIPAVPKVMPKKESASSGKPVE